MTYTFGVEVEYTANADGVAHQLARLDWGNAERHGYHCDCDSCDSTDPEWWKYQRDSTVEGEFISGVFDTNNWPTATLAFGVLSDASLRARAVAGPSAGMHIHVAEVASHTAAQFPTIAAAYLLTERYVLEIVAPGASRAKREMNCTLGEAVRSFASDWGGPLSALREHGPFGLITAAVYRDKHVDLNYSGRLDTVEFRAYNSTLAAWRMELAARLSVAFFAAAPSLLVASAAERDADDVLADVITTIYDSDYATKRPLIDMATFTRLLCDHDEALRPLLDRQVRYMRRAWQRRASKPSPTATD